MTIAQLRAKWEARQSEWRELGAVVNGEQIAADVLRDLGSLTGASTEAVTPTSESDEWLTADECAARLHVSPRWCYDHAQQLGVKKLSRRCVRFSARAVQRHMARRS